MSGLQQIPPLRAGVSFRDIDGLEEKKFRKRLMGLDPVDVKAFLLDINGELRRLKNNAGNRLTGMEQEISEMSRSKPKKRSLPDGCQKRAS